MSETMFSDFVPLRKSNPTQRNSLHKHVDWTRELDADKVRSKYGIDVDGNNIPAPFESFEEMSFPIHYLAYLKKKNVNKPTPIQMQAISCLVNQRDVIAISPTGCGKTYAYILPLLILLEKHIDSHVYNNAAPMGLILVPSRELMTQVLKSICDLLEVRNIEESSNVSHHNDTNYTSNIGHPCNNSFQDVCAGLSINSSVPQQCYPKTYEQKEAKIHNHVVGICGGLPIINDINKLHGQTNVIVATPGRLIDLCDRNKISLSKVKYFVIDECDRFFDMGLEGQLRKIVAMVTVHGESLQTSLWSATLPESLNRIARSAVVDPVYICTGIKYDVGSNIKQNVIFLHNFMKEKTLLCVLRQIPYPPVIIFVQTKHKADEVTELLQSEQFHAAVIHSDKDQSCRNEVMSSFKNGELDVLVSTDLISRGMDIPTVTHIINYDTPETIEDYLHRCGRTGRMGREGSTTTFLTLDCKIANELKEMLESSNTNVPTELLDTSIFGKKVVSTDMGDMVIK